MSTDDKDALFEALAQFNGVTLDVVDIGPDAVSESMIRHWCVALGDTNPVYTDTDVAAAGFRRGHPGQSRR